MTTKEIISKYSNEKLHESLQAVSSKEHEATAEILMHLAEVQDRKLFRDRGFNNLFAYCTGSKLKYSEASAGRRTKAAKVIARHPELIELFLSKELNLCSLSLIESMLTDENKDEVIEAVRGKGRRIVELFVSGYKPKKAMKERIKPVTVSKEQTSSPLFDSNSQVAENTHSTGGVNKTNELEEKRYELHFSVSQELMRKFEEAKVLLSNKYPRGALLEQIFDECLEAYLDKNSPKRRDERRVKRQKAKAQPKAADNPVSHSMGPSSKEAPDVVENGIVLSKLKQSRHIPRAIQDKVKIRDRQRCTYVSEDGRRCDCSHDLEIHHEHAFAKGGRHEIGNLRLLCRAHNALLAEREFGSQHRPLPAH